MSKQGGKKSSSHATTSMAPRSKKNRHTSMHELPWPMTDSMRERYSTLSTRKIVPTKYIDVDSLDQVGLTDRVRQYLTNVSWVQFAALRPPTYKELTLEFLCSLECCLHKGQPEELGNVRFRLLGKNISMTVEDIDELLGFTSHGTEQVLHGESVDSLWTNLTGSTDYNSSQSKATNLGDPALRYLHRFMTGSIFGRGLSIGVCGKNEVYILHAMVTGEEINTGYWMLEHMQRVARYSKGDICVGGIVTMLAQQLGIALDESQLTKVEGKSEIDMEIMVYMGLVKKIKGCYTLVEVEPRQEAESDEDMENMEQSEDEEQIAPPSFPSESVPESSSHPSNASMNMILTKLDQMRIESQSNFHKLQRQQYKRWKQTNQRIESLEKKIDDWMAAEDETDDD